MSRYETEAFGENQTRILLDEAAGTEKGVEPLSRENAPVANLAESTVSVSDPEFSIVMIQRFELPVRLVPYSYEPGTLMV